MLDPHQPPVDEVDEEPIHALPRGPNHGSQIGLCEGPFQPSLEPTLGVSLRTWFGVPREPRQPATDMLAAQVRDILGGSADPGD